ncbi:MAG: SAM-dependent methyltransferase [Bacteroidaceae bacterium]|nr:SAM-dependent methyltransferase [Bacteroidaceae bacterium]
MQTALYLIPVTLGDTEIDRVLPHYNRSIIAGISHYVVENIRSARRFLRRSNPDIVIDDLTFYTLDEHTRPEEIASYLAPLREGKPMGVISEAGCPAIADPGADLVAIAQREGLPVVPLVGPSSILMSLMASGFNGQSFAFNGYLPVEPAERTRKIKQLEQRVYSEDQTQIFIETPYRNHKMIEELVRTCRPNTHLCVACDISCESEEIHTRTIAQWKKAKYDIQKRPAIFLIYK